MKEKAPDTIVSGKKCLIFPLKKCLFEEKGLISICILVQKHRPHLEERPGKCQSYFFHLLQKTLLQLKAYIMILHQRTHPLRSFPYPNVQEGDL